MSSCPVRLSFSDPLPAVYHEYESTSLVSWLSESLPRFFFAESDLQLQDVVQGSDDNESDNDTVTVDYLLRVASFWILVSVLLLLWIGFIITCYFKYPKSLLSGQRPMSNPPPVFANEEQTTNLSLRYVNGYVANADSDSSSASSASSSPSSSRRLQSLTSRNNAQTTSDTDVDGSKEADNTTTTLKQGQVRRLDLAENYDNNVMEDFDDGHDNHGDNDHDDDIRNQAFIQDDDDDDEDENRNHNANVPAPRIEPPKSPPVSPPSKYLSPKTEPLHHHGAVQPSPYNSTSSEDDDDDHDQDNHHNHDKENSHYNKKNNNSFLEKDNVNKHTQKDPVNDTSMTSATTASSNTSSKYDEYRRYLQEAASSRPKLSLLGVAANDRDTSRDSTDDSDDWLLEECLRDAYLEHSIMTSSTPGGSTAISSSGFGGGDATTTLLDSLNTTNTSFPEASPMMTSELPMAGVDDDDGVGFLLFQDTSLDDSATDHFQEDSLLFPNNNNNNKYNHNKSNTTTTTTANTVTTARDGDDNNGNDDDDDDPLSTSIAALSLPRSNFASRAASRKRLLENYVEAFKSSSSLSFEQKTPRSGGSIYSSTSISTSTSMSLLSNNHHQQKSPNNTTTTNTSSSTNNNDISTTTTSTSTSKNPSKRTISVSQMGTANNNNNNTDVTNDTKNNNVSIFENSDDNNITNPSMDTSHSTMMSYSKEESVIRSLEKSNSRNKSNSTTAYNNSNNNINNDNSADSSTNTDDTTFRYDMSDVLLDTHQHHHHHSSNLIDPEEEKKEESGLTLSTEPYIVMSATTHLQEQRPISPMSKMDKDTNDPYHHHRQFSPSCDNANNIKNSSDFNNGTNTNINADKNADDPPQYNNSGNDTSKIAATTPVSLRKQKSQKTYKTQHELAMAWKEWSKQESRYECQLQLYRIIVVLATTLLIVSTLMLILNGISYLDRQTAYIIETLFQGLSDKADQLNRFLQTLQQLQNSVLQQTWNIWQLLDQNCPLVRSSVCSLNTECNVTGLPLESTWNEWLDFVQPSNVANLYQGENWTSWETDIDSWNDVHDRVETSAVYWQWALWTTCACNAVLAVLAFAIMVGTSFDVAFLASRWFAVIYWFFVLLAWVFATVFWIGTVVTADACTGIDNQKNDETDNLATLLLEKHVQPKSFLSNYWEYYINGCQEEEYPSFVNDRVWLWATLLPPTQRLADGLANFDPAIFEQTCGTAIDPLTNAASVLNLQLCMVTQALGNIRRVLACDQWYPFYQSLVYEAVCYQGTQGLMWGASAQIVILLSAVLIWTLRAAFLPVKELKAEEEEDDDDDDEKEDRMAKDNDKNSDNTYCMCCCPQSGSGGFPKASATQK